MTDDRARPRRRRSGNDRGDRDDQPVLPSRSRDDSDVGWGDERTDRSGERDEDWYRRERPPHHGD